jgi:hypothetical protein
VDIELVEYVDHVGAFGLYGDVQLLRDVLAVEALGEGLDSTCFSRGVRLPMVLWASYSSWASTLKRSSLCLSCSWVL